MKHYFKCPKCGCNKQFSKPSERATGMGCLFFLYGGFIPGLLYADYTRRRIQCGSCTHIFRQPPIPSSTLARFAGGILVLTFTLTCIAIVLFLTESNTLPNFALITLVEEAITEQPRLAAYLLTLLLIPILIICSATICVSNFRFRKRLSTKHHLKPHYQQEPARPNNTEPSTINSAQKV